MCGFHINEPPRLPAIEIFCAAPVGMLLESTPHVIGDAGIKRVVAAMDDIDEPSHRPAYTAAPNRLPTPAVKPIASAPQKVTRTAPLIKLEPPV